VPQLPVYSTLFVREAGLVGPVYYDISDGTVVVVRSVDVYFGGGSLFPETFRLKDLTSTATVVFMQYDIGVGGGRQWVGRQVFTPTTTGNSLEFVATSAMDVSVSGYVLTNPPA
jgi:hypothetical protein